MSNPFDILLDRSPEMPSTWRWASVASVDPLRIRLDGDDDPLDAKPVNLAGPLTVGTRVWVQLHRSHGSAGARPFIHGYNQDP